MAGVVLQGITRNGLADPGILGINAGASAAVVIFMFFFQLRLVAADICSCMDGRGDLEYSQTFVKRYQHSDEKLFIGVGELEKFMVDDAKIVADRLEKTMRTSFYVALEENHASIVPTVLSRALRFVNED